MNIGKEMVELLKNDILQQAGKSMLAQSIQNAEGFFEAPEVIKKKAGRYGIPGIFICPSLLSSDL